MEIIDEMDGNLANTGVSKMDETIQFLYITMYALE